MHTEPSTKPAHTTAAVAEQGSGWALNADDVKRLLEDESSDVRVDISEKVAKGYNAGAYGEKEIAVAEQIFRLLMKDVEVRVRASLAEYIKDNDNIPRDVALSLAKDEKSVAEPILECSHVLSDADLLDVIATSRDVATIEAITRRDGVSERVSDALVETRYPQVVRSLLKNVTARISESSFGKIMEHHERDAEVVEAMVERQPHMPLAVAEKLITVVSEELVSRIEKEYDISLDDLREDAAKSREDVTLRMLAYDVDDASLKKMVSQMIANDRLTPSIIMAGLCRGSMGFFEIALAQMADIPLPNARKLIYDKGQLGFKALYDKTDLPESMFEAVKLLLKANRELLREDVQPQSSGYANRLVEKLLFYSAESEVENLSYIIALVRQKSNDF